MKLLLSTSNILTAGSPVHRTKSGSNTEFVDFLQANFVSRAEAIVETGNGLNDNQIYQKWTRHKGDVLEIPALDLTSSGLREASENYDITVKLFYLPDVSLAQREVHTRDALQLVLRELHVSSVNLLIVSFSGVFFDEGEDCPGKLSTRGPVEAQAEPIEVQIETWRVLESLHDEGLVKKLGIAELGHDRLLEFLQRTRIPPAVDQINLRYCCSVPPSLMNLAKSRNVELLVHNDTSNILPRGTVRELLGPSGANILAEHDQGDAHGHRTANAGMKGEVLPLWVVKYTAVVSNRGVVENKGYFAEAELLPT
ncbi:putative gamma-cysteine synthetase regulatory subunit [Piedraia hortae CBS 480.64]|uniref:GCS light chain n=1 Tax=Piedraia hortae CBS 480.64 TaxID=1314780 RepID=A0A6A7BTF5_9PEZI|nr:putative gamma-cysteine synthetase regulatory subunit [Piedraia hortae CBS 480.64]